MNPSTQLKKAILLFLVALTCLALSPAVRAVSPPPDGGYPNENTAEGDDALFSLTFGANNTAIGFRALFRNTLGSDNTATGTFALFNTTGSCNTATGSFALFSNTTGRLNTATGFAALVSNTTGNFNTATGVQALVNNTTGDSNTATGFAALFRNTTGHFNTATGGFALATNTDGNSNTANGRRALEENTTGDNNTAMGDQALRDNTTGSSNTATGADALQNNTDGGGNTATGRKALEENTTGGSNTASGQKALHRNTTGSFNIALGSEAGVNLTTGDNNIYIGNAGVAAESSTIRIGTPGTQTKTFIAGISDAAIGGMEVRVNQNGRLGTVPSSNRFKEVINPMDKASEAILALKPVTFRYKEEIDPERAPQFGLVAEDVEKVNPDLVLKDAKGKVYAVRYDAVNAMLLNEFLKEHRKVEHMQKQIEALAAGLQKVSAQLEATRSAPQTVLNNY